MFLKFKNFIRFIIPLLIIGGAPFAYASITDGTIDDTFYSAILCKNDTCNITSLINFKTTLGNQIHITDTKIKGNAWSEDMGWINLSPTMAGVTNTSTGVLGGYAWGENAGWINFKPSRAGVTINSNGEFVGYAWSQNFGWIKFDCAVAGACVKTDWRPTVIVVTPPSTGGGTISNPPPVVPPEEPTVPPVVPPIDEPEIPPVVEPETPPIVTPEEPTVPPGEQEPPIGTPVPPTDTGPNNPPGNTTPPSNETGGNGNGGGGGINLGNIGDTVGTISNAIGNQVIKTTTDIVNKTAEVAKKAKDKISEISNTPAGNIVSKISSTTGIVSGTAVSVATVLFANPLSLSELFLIPFRLWSLLLIAFGLKRRNLPWGTVYDSVTKQPLDPAVVVLQDLEGNEVTTSITDLDGRYGFLVPAGQYRMIANKTNYEFPSKKLLGKDRDELYQELYFSEVITVKEGEVITRNIPMDPLKFDWNEFAKRDQKLMKFFSVRDLWIVRISNILFVFGFIISAIAAIVIPVFYNIAIFGVYLVLIALKRTILKPRAFGHIEEKETKNPLPFSILRVFFTGTEHEIIHKVADKTGKYYCLVPNGSYYTKIESKNLDETYTLAHISEPIEVKSTRFNKKASSTPCSACFFIVIIVKYLH
jgi:hypothetical protein